MDKFSKYSTELRLSSLNSMVANYEDRLETERFRQLGNFLGMHDSAFAYS